MAGASKFVGAFWTGYIFITLAFIGQLVCSYFALKAESLQKMFYNIPLITISYTGLIVMLADDLDLTESSANEVITLVEERNSKCKLLK